MKSYHLLIPNVMQKLARWKCQVLSHVRYLCLISLFFACDASAKAVQMQTKSGSQELFVVNSIPKCGTHCIIETLRLITGKRGLNDTVTPDTLAKAMRQNGFVKTIDPYSKANIAFLISYQHKIISMYRDPRDALVSHLFYMRELWSKGRHRDFFIVSNNFDSLSLDDQLSLLITGAHDMRSYLDFYSERMGWAFDPYVLSIKYEDLVGSKGGGSDERQMWAISSIISYLNISADNKDVLHVMDNLYKTQHSVIQGNKEFKRAAIGNWRTFFSDRHKAEFKAKFGHSLILLGYEKNNNW